MTLLFAALGRRSMLSQMLQRQKCTAGQKLIWSFIFFCFFFHISTALNLYDSQVPADPCVFVLSHFGADGTAATLDKFEISIKFI